MKRAVLLAIAAAAMLLPSVPASADKSRPSGIVTVGHRRGYYHRPYWGGGWGWGGWGWGGYWGPYWGGYYYPYYYGGYYRGYNGGPYGYGPSPDWAAIDTDVSPEDALVYLDGTLIGRADDFDGFPDYLYLKRGGYRVEFRLAGYETRTAEVQARPGMKLSIDESLHKIPGSKQYGSYEEIPLPEGGVHRFWGKRQDGAAPIEDDEEIYGRAPDRYQDDDRDADVQDSDEEAEVERDTQVETPRDSSGVRSEEWRGRSQAPKAPARETAWLRFSVEPSDAVIFLDDRFVGTAQEIASLSPGVSVTPGRHTVTVSRPGYKDRTVTITVEPGETEPVEVELRR
jgi:hypothetical protein